MHRWTARASIALALLAAPVIFDYTTTRMIDRVWTYRACGLLAAIGIIIGVLIHRPQRAFAWYLIAAGNLVFVAGDLVYQIQDAAGAPPFPGSADVFYLAGYPFLAIGLACLVGRKGKARGSFIDASILATSAGLLTWVFLMEPYATDPALTLSERVVSLAYPVGDLLLISTVCWFVFTGHRNASVNWLLVSTVALVIGDSIYGVQVLAGTYSVGWVDGAFLISYLTFAAAGIHPSMRSITSSAEGGRVTMSRARLGLLAGAAVLGPVLSVTSHGSGGHLVTTMGTIVLFLLTFGRMAGLMRSVERNSSLLENQGRELEAAVDGLKDLEVARRHLLEAIHAAAEKERSALAIELHDGPIQHLTTLGFEADLATSALERGDTVATLSALEVLESGLVVEVTNLRALMTDLRPPALDERGLGQALSDYVSAFRLRTDIACELSLDLPQRPDRASKTILYRVAQEALTNAAKHSAATHIIVTCRTGTGRAELSIVDNGIGFDLTETNLTGMDGHLGLASIRERIEFAGGTCSVASAIGAGTSVTVSLELEGSDDGEVAHLAG